PRSDPRGARELAAASRLDAGGGSELLQHPGPPRGTKDPERVAAAGLAPVDEALGLQRSPLPVPFWALPLVRLARLRQAGTGGLRTAPRWELVRGSELTPPRTDAGRGRRQPRSARAPRAPRAGRPTR